MILLDRDLTVGGVGVVAGFAGFGDAIAADRIAGVAYAIGVADPVSIHVDSYGTGKVEDAKMADIRNTGADIIVTTNTP